MKKLILSVFIFTFGFGTATHAQQVNTLLTKHLPEAPGKEIEVITVNYAPGAVDAIHRHDAHAVVYVLDGEVEMQVRGGTLRRPMLLFETGLPTRYYIPKLDGRMDLLEPSEYVTRCPYKGVASHWSARLGDKLVKDIVWSGHMKRWPD